MKSLRPARLVSFCVRVHRSVPKMKSSIYESVASVLALAGFTIVQLARRHLRSARWLGTVVGAIEGSGGGLQELGIGVDLSRALPGSHDRSNRGYVAEVGGRSVAQAKLFFSFMPIASFSPSFKDQVLEDFLSGQAT